VAAIHAASKRSYGRPRIVQDLRNQGVLVGHESVRRSLQRQGLRPVYKRPYRITTDSNHRKAVAPNLLDRRFDGWQINQAWLCDITYVGTAAGWRYLATVMDLGSRRIVGWSMSERMKADLVCDALKSAYWRRKPVPGLIQHCDRGSQYVSDQYRRLVGDFAMVQSMSRKGNCWDTQFAVRGAGGKASATRSAGGGLSVAEHRLRQPSCKARPVNPQAVERSHSKHRRQCAFPRTRKGIAKWSRSWRAECRARRVVLAARCLGSKVARRTDSHLGGRSGASVPGENPCVPIGSC
jgi:putative transposase